MVDVKDVTLAMIDYYQGYPKQIQHFLKVHSFARIIGLDEGLSDDEQEILEIAALVHDIGIKPAWSKYNSSNGKYQEELGPDEAIKLLGNLNYRNDLIERVAYLVGHHHTYKDINDIDYQILVEADFLVNLYENNSDVQAIDSAYSKIFKTKLGKKICQTMFIGD